MDRERATVQTVPASMMGGLLTVIKVILYICLIIILCQYVFILAESLP